MKNQEKDPLARFLFSSVVDVSIILVAIGIALSATPGGATLGLLGGAIIDKWLWSGGPSFFAALGVFAGICGPLLFASFFYPKLEKWAALREKCFAWRFLDDITDLISAVIRGIGSIIVSAGLGAMAGVLVVLGILIIEWYCHRVGIPFPTLSPQFRHDLVGYWALVGVLWQAWRERGLVVQKIQP